MKFTALDIDNFLAIQTASLQLADRGLNVIQGVNDSDSSASSNGAGKSSIVDALCWCLYGVTAREVKGDAVVNRTAKKNTRVQVTMVNGDTEYRVVRHRKHTAHKNALHLFAGAPLGPLTDLSRGTDSETQKEVERVLGCTVEVFLAAIYAGQEIMPDLPKMTDRELKSLIEEAAGMRRIEAAYEEARARRTQATADVTRANDRIDTVKGRLVRDESSLLGKTQDFDDWATQRAVRVGSAEEKVNEAQGTLNALTAALIARHPEHTARQARTKELDDALLAYSKVEAVARAAELASNTAERAVNRALLTSTRETVATIEAQIVNVDEAMKEPCEQCGKPHDSEDRELYLGHRQKRLDDVKGNLALVRVKVAQQASDALRLQTAATASRALVPDVTAVNVERQQLKFEMDKFDQFAKGAQVAKTNLTAFRTALATRQSEVNPFESVVATLQGQIARDGAELATLVVGSDVAREKLELANHVVKVFGPAGVRAQILDTVTPFLNDRTADYLSALTDGGITATWSTLTKAASGELKEKFSIEVTSATGGESFLSLSGGEKRKVRLATALALQDLVASRATQSIDIWIGDEVDDALDPAGLERLMTILERKARERGTVLIISHNDLADWCDNVTTVRKVGGYSLLEGSLCI